MLRKKTFREIINDKLYLKDDKDRTLKDTIDNKLLKLALAGNVKAINLIMHTITGLPDKTNI